MPNQGPTAGLQPSMIHLSCGRVEMVQALADMLMCHSRLCRLQWASSPPVRMTVVLAATEARKRDHVSMRHSSFCRHLWSMTVLRQQCSSC